MPSKQLKNSLALEKQELKLKPIGFIRAAERVKFDAPHQPDRSKSKQSIVELLPHKGLREALQDLSGFEYIWLIWWFHRNENWRPMVLPPRGPQKRRGVFSTRSPHRPNPIGITAVKLIKIKGLILTIGDHDLVDGTPIFDIKPYLTSADCFPGAKCGWLTEIEDEMKNPPLYKVFYSDLAATQLSWLKAREINFIDRSVELLERDPSPHRTRRISKPKDGIYRMGCGAWRLFYSLDERNIIIEKVSAGYPRKLLLDEGCQEIPDRDEQLAFDEKWPED